MRSCARTAAPPVLCWISTRILVPQRRYAEYVGVISGLVASQSVGDPFDTSTDVGPMASSRHRDRVERYIKAGVSAGARVTTGGGRPKNLDRGWYVDPTVFADTDNESVIAREEIFGPVLCVIPYSDVDQAVAMANDSEYGLAGTVWSADPQRGQPLAVFPVSAAHFRGQCFVRYRAECKRHEGDYSDGKGSFQTWCSRIAALTPARGRATWSGRRQSAV